MRPCRGRRRPGFLRAALVLMAAATPAAAEPPDVRKLLDTSLEWLRGADREAWARHAFKRQVTRQEVDEDGDVTWRQVMLFQVTPTGDGFDELLLEIDGRPPTEQEVRKHRKAGRFEKHYSQTREVQLENPFGDDLPLLPLLFDQRHTWAGEDEVDGIPCHRLRFEARPEPAGVPVHERLKRAMTGTLCVSKEGSRMFHAELETVRPVAKAPVRIHSMRLRFEARPFHRSWLPTRFEVQSDIKLPLGIDLRKHNIYRYSDFRRIGG